MGLNGKAVLGFVTVTAAGIVFAVHFNEKYQRKV
jgi:hypothetical protein